MKALLALAVAVALVGCAHGSGDRPTKASYGSKRVPVNATPPVPPAVSDSSKE